MTASMTRRSFHALAISAATLGSLGLLRARAAMNGWSGYGTAIAFVRTENIFRFWIYALNRTSPNDDVPVTLTLAAKSQAGQVIFSESYLARAADSHVARPCVFLSSSGLPPASRLYCQLLVGEQRTPAKTLVMRTALS